MLNLAKMSRYRKGSQGVWTSLDDSVIDPSIYRSILCGPHLGDVEVNPDRIFCRVWFSLINHPDFQQPWLLQLGATVYQHFAMMLTTVFSDLEMEWLYHNLDAGVLGLPDLLPV
jgi:hypothetical protein